MDTYRTKGDMLRCIFAGVFNRATRAKGHWRAYKEMSENDDIIGAMLLLLEMLIGGR